MSTLRICRNKRRRHPRRERSREEISKIHGLNFCMVVMPSTAPLLAASTFWIPNFNNIKGIEGILTLAVHVFR
jgi:hypothetical protein